MQRWPDEYTIGVRHPLVLGPWLHEFPDEAAVARYLQTLVYRWNIVTLNIAGNRERTQPGIGACVERLLRVALARPVE